MIFIEGGVPSLCMIILYLYRLLLRSKLEILEEKVSHEYVTLEKMITLTYSFYENWFVILICY